MISPTLFGYVGVTVTRLPYHIECAPDGPTSPIFAHEENVIAMACAACHNPLVDITAEPEEEEFEGEFCRYCGFPLPVDALLVGSEFCDEECEGGYSHAW